MFEPTTCGSYHSHPESIKLVLELQVYIHICVSLAFDDTRKFKSHLIDINANEKKTDTVNMSVKRLNWDENRSPRQRNKYFIIVSYFLKLLSILHFQVQHISKIFFHSLFPVSIGSLLSSILVLRHLSLSRYPCRRTTRTGRASARTLAPSPRVPLRYPDRPRLGSSSPKLLVCARVRPRFANNYCVYQPTSVRVCSFLQLFGFGLDLTLIKLSLKFYKLTKYKIHLVMCQHFFSKLTVHTKYLM